MSKAKKTTQPLSPMQRLANWLRAHRLDVLLTSLLVLAAGTVSAINMAGSPQRFEDEGTYVSQAWAVEYKGHITHYTYWYDHPPLAWIQLAAYTTATGAFERYESSITAGREFMVVLHVLSVVLVYAICRRLGLNAWLATVAGVLFSFSPLSLEFSRYVLLDNIALPWLLGAFFLALTPRKHLIPIVMSAVCMAIAVLSKETFLLFLPALVYALWRNSDVRNRRFLLSSFAIIFLTITGFYLLYAVLKNELFPGTGHVSLIGTLLWQLFGRAGSGSVLSATSDARNLFNYWMGIDGWLFWTSMVALPFAWFHKAARPFALALLIGVVAMFRNGYLPYPYIIALLPLSAIVIAAALQRFVAMPLASTAQTTMARLRKYSAGAAALALVFAFVAVVIPVWQPRIHASLTADLDQSSRQAVVWINQNVSRENRIVVESALWTDLQDKGFNKPQPVWLYKTETDPEVAATISGWRGIDYIVLNGPTLNESSRAEFPTVFEAKDHAKVVATFGKDAQKIVIMRVDNGIQK